jgi:CRISPR/Cas system-associated exonuclease Cas4 (RecB family)
MTITPSLFEAFLKCPTKCWLRFANEPPSGNPYAEWVQGETESYRAAVAKQFTANMPEGECAAFCSSRREEAQTSAENLKTAKWRLAMDIVARTELGSSRGNEAQTEKLEMDQSLLTSAATIETSLHAVERIPSAGRGQPAQFVPIRFIHRNKLTKDDKLLLAFDAFALSEMLGRAVSLGKIIHGDDRDCARSSRGNEAQTEKSEIANPKSEISQSLLTAAATHNGVEKPQTGISATLGQAQPRVTKVKTAALAGEVRKRLGKITALLASPTPPDLVLNRHCAECEFQARCRKLAVEKDDLSLLAGMSTKERQKLRGKGIFTVTQLSYTFRPRRRPKRQRDKREKYHHALKALAIREQKIHIVGSPEFKLEGTPVYLDVEGLPDRDFYYLIGVRIGHGDSAVQHSLWADTVADEGKIWREFLAILETVEQPVLIHYGSYETTFLKVMKERHGGPMDESVAAKAIGSAINLVSVMFAKIYFSTFSNSLKEIARNLGFNWSATSASGVQSIVWRETWSKLRDSLNHQNLISYNADDCAALGMVTQRVLELHPTPAGLRVAEDRDIIDATTLKREHPYGFKRNKFAIPELEGINNAAYWDYQRDRVFVKSNSGLRGRSNLASRPKQVLAPNKTVECGRARRCPKCNSNKVVKHLQYGKTVIDLKFTRHGIKRWITHYRFHRYLCQECGATFYPHERCWTRSKFGFDLIAYVLYLNIELRLPQIHVDHNLNKLFGFDSEEGCTTQKIKIWSAKTYKDTYDALIKNLCNGQLLHADETKISVRGTNAFVWIFANMEEVAYIYTETREGDFLQVMLKDFKGVLVSDFYAAYDAIPCPQQKCLIHLIRDLNDDLLKRPYDEELKRIAQSFTALLKPMVETIDRYGLKKRFLGKHLADVKRFYREMSDMTMHSETAVKLKDRLEKNRGKLFTFLSFDGVPWNNNNAEHAVKPFAALRHVMGGITTEKGLREYLILLSVCQTCKYMGVDFLDFLRSGEKDIHAFAESRRRHKHPKQTTQPTDLPANAIPDSGGQS